MADTNLTTGAWATATLRPTDTSRRALLGGAGIIAALTVAPLAASTAKAASAAISPELTRLIAAVKAASAAEEAYCVNVYDPADARRAAAITHAKETLPHVTVSRSDNMTGGQVNWSTGNPTAVAVCRALARRTSGLAKNDPEANANARRLVAAHYRREREIEMVRRADDTTAETDECNRLNALTATAEDAVCAFPAATIHDLCAKLTFIVERHLGDEMNHIPSLLADVSRIAGER